MSTYYIDGYRIAANSYNQALEAARQLKAADAPKGSWPGEAKPTARVDEAAHWRAVS
jgi:hypothetical protein